MKDPRSWENTRFALLVVGAVLVFWIGLGAIVFLFESWNEHPQ